MVNANLIKKYISETFILDSKSGYKQTTFNLINRFFNMSEKPYDEFDRQTMLDIYSRLGIMKMNVFHSHKSKITDFMRWMHETGNGSVKPLEEIRDIYFGSVDRSEFYDTYYFSDLNDLINVLETVFDASSEFLTFCSATLLIWHGIQLKYLPMLLKTDLNDDGVILHPLTKEPIQLASNAIPYLKNYRDASSFVSGKFGRITIPYVNTPYLFRSYINVRLTDKRLNNVSSSANKVAAEVGKAFHWKRIYDSGLFFRVYQYELANGEISRNDYALLKNLFQMPHVDISTRQRFILAQKYNEYQEFKYYKYSR